ncbi:AbgT family transporter [Hirschia maritima]|uniref:AbgT family transporter n=1 Tax=Hirschia maritima TaxID=1121961 RepID=UPI00068557C2
MEACVGEAKEDGKVGGILGWVERTGNKLPDPVVIFFYLAIVLIAISVVAALSGLSALHPTQVDSDGNPIVIVSESLLSGDNIAKFWVEMTKTFSHFHPLGYVLVVMLGAGVAERSGLFGAAMRAALGNAPKLILTPMVALIAMIANHAADAAYVVMIPLAGIMFHAVGRHPVAGIAAAFAGVSGGFSANILPGQLDVLLFGITETAVDGSALDASWTMNVAGNWWFIFALTFIYLPVIWFVTDKIVEPRLANTPFFNNANEDEQEADPSTELKSEEKKGLGRAGFALLAVVGVWLLMTFAPGTPLINEAACTVEAEQAGECAGVQRLAPFFKSLVGGFMVLFLAAGWAYGSAVGTVKNHKDLVAMMAEGMKDMGYYLVLAFAAAHFVALFNWSNLGLIFAIHGAAGIEASGLPLPIAMGLIVLLSATLNLFVGSASAKWALLAPVLVPMLMLLGISPEGATAIYRVGDGATNIITPLMVYFPLVLVFAQRWNKDFGLGSLTAMMIPYSIWMLITGLLLVVLWVFLGIDMGPGAPTAYALPK